MKKILLLLSILSCAATVNAQKYLEVYHGKDVIGSMMSTDIDSVRITGNNASTRQINFYSAGVNRSFAVSEVDSIKIVHSSDDSFAYLGIVGFNQELYDMPIGILATSTSSRYSSFVSNLICRDGTLLYYGVEHALNLLTQYNFTTPLSSVNLITFTDGLDQGSMMMSSVYTTEEAYLNALNRQIVSSKVKGLPITAYSLGLRGNDVSDYNQFRTNLQQLATSADKAIEVSSMSDVQKRLQEIADLIISVSNLQTVSVKIPGVSNGTRIRFTFDGNSPEYSTMYIEGTFNLADRSLRNVTYNGMRATSGSTLQGAQDGIFVTYKFTGLQRTDGNGLIPMGYIRQYNKAVTSDTWQRNSEFTPDNNTQTTITHAGTAIMLVLDCSSSLGSQFSNMQSYARDFISRVANNAAPYEIMAPTNVVASLDEQHNFVNVTWNAVKNAQSYDVYRNGSIVQEDVRTTQWTDKSPLRTNVYSIVAKGYGMTSEKSSPSNRVGTYSSSGITIDVNGVKFTMIKVEGGTFQMGGILDDYEKPIHQVTLTNDYYIGETEVTQELWTAVMGSNPSYFKSSDQLPVEQVSWNDCQTFISKLNTLTGRTFRLPSEAEWEFAARGGNASEGYTYSGSNTVGDVAWYDSNSSSKTHEVATKAPNELGIYDMSGNVWEWCQDWYGSYSSSAQTNPTGPTSGSFRVYRGGGWNYFDYNCRVAVRDYVTPDFNYFSGFRLAL